MPAGPAGRRPKPLTPGLAAPRVCNFGRRKCAIQIGVDSVASRPQKSRRRLPVGLLRGRGMQLVQRGRTRTIRTRRSRIRTIPASVPFIEAGRALRRLRGHCRSRTFQENYGGVQGSPIARHRIRDEKRPPPLAMSWSSFVLDPSWTQSVMRQPTVKPLTACSTNRPGRNRTCNPRFWSALPATPALALLPDTWKYSRIMSHRHPSSRCRSPRH